MKENTHPNLENNRKPFLRRLWIYQGERFPVFQHGMLITVFTFSAACFSRLCRNEISFIPVKPLVTGSLTAILFFFLLRLFDEFKDYEEDAKYRPYRAVPRGLLTFSELRLLIIISIGIQVGLNAVFMPRMLVPIALVLVYMGLMTREFFISGWLKRHPMVYMASHMVIMPLIDFYTTGLDWIHGGFELPEGLWIFLVVSFFNGMVIEVGRKIRAPEDEETGVETYSALYGPHRAVILWSMVLGMTFISALGASTRHAYMNLTVALLLVVLVLSAVPAVLFYRSHHKTYAKLIETSAGIWTIGMYLILGATPMIVQLIRN